MIATTRACLESDIDPRFEEALRYAVAIGAVLVLLLPVARGSHAAIGWLPLWLLGMPLSAWWALHRFSAQARRRPHPARRVDLPQAASSKRGGIERDGIRLNAAGER